MSNERVWVSSPNEEEERSCGEEHEEDQAHGGFVAMDEKSEAHLCLMADLMEAETISEPAYMMWAVLAALQHSEIPSA